MLCCTLREKLIRDQLIVGVTDDTLSSKLQSETNLTLTADVDICRQHKSAKQLQTVVRPQATVDMVKQGKQVIIVIIIVTN